ncbi:hypothetical protein [Yinghuangia sp. YIM S09857]|uniref:hypothetical protein n=1 Tax=Yinghuangia sp. YIM S09857 TaxID=3436929 RepID=UPI003F536A77
MSPRGGDARLSARFDGSPFVTLTLWHARRTTCHRATGVAHELGYRLTRVATTRSAVFLDFRRDDTPPAQARAAASLAVWHTTGQLPDAPDAGGVSAAAAAGARFRVAAHRPPVTLRLVFGLWAAVVFLATGGALAGVGSTVGYPLLGVGGLCLLGSLLTIAAGPRRRARHARDLALLKRYDDARNPRR